MKLLKNGLLFVMINVLVDGGILLMVYAVSVKIAVAYFYNAMLLSVLVHFMAYGSGTKVETPSSQPRLEFAPKLFVRSRSTFRQNEINGGSHE